MARVPGTRTRQHDPKIYFGLSVIPDNAPTELKNQLAARNQTWVDGRCPHCACEPELTAHPELNLVQVDFRHHPDCPVSDLLDPQDT